MVAAGHGAKCTVVHRHGRAGGHERGASNVKLDELRPRETLRFVRSARVLELDHELSFQPLAT